MSRKHSESAEGELGRVSESTVDRARIEAAVSEIIAAIGEDPARPGLRKTPQRVAEAYTEFFSGVAIDPVSHLNSSKTFSGDSQELGELVVMRDIDFRSVCEHHLLPFSGVAHIAYKPRTRIVGLGRLPRVVDTIAARPQVQERLTEQIADALQRGLDPLGVMVVLDAVHACVWSRGERQTSSSTVTMATRGTFTEPTARAEVVAMIGRGKGSDV